MRDGQANRIDGLNIKPLWLLQKIPSAAAVVLQGAARQLDFLRLIAGLCRILCDVQRLEHPLPHLGSCGEREGDGQNLFRLVHFGKQLQQASSQQLRLARTSGSLHQKGLAGLECLRAGVLVDRLQQQFSHRFHPPRRWYCRDRFRQSGRDRRGRKTRRSWDTV